MPFLLLDRGAGEGYNGHDSILIKGAYLPMNIGPRIWKTGLAVIISSWFGQILAPDWTFAAVVAAIISVQPTIGVSIEKGVDRILGTLVGAVVGSIFYVLIGDDLVTMGLAVVITIMICIRFQWQNAIVLACLMVTLIMMGRAGDNFLLYAGNRILLTLLGVLTGFLINVGIFPPRPQDMISQELVEVGENIEILYNNAVLWFISRQCYQPTNIEALMEKTRNRISQTKQQALALKTEIGTRRFFSLKDKRKRSLLLYDLTVLMNLIFERTLNIHQMAQERSRRIKEGPKSQEFTQMVYRIRQLLNVISGVQRNLLAYLSTGEIGLQEIIRQQFLDFQEAQEEVRKSLDSWQSAHPGMENISSMMELSILAHELERIGEYQLRIRDLLLENGKELKEDPDAKVVSSS